MKLKQNNKLQGKKVFKEQRREAQRDRREHSVKFFRRIHTKMIAGFLLPVCCIVLLGVVSYQKASSVIISNYENSISQTLDMTGQYFTFSLGVVRSHINEFYTDVNVNDYYAGRFELSATREIQFFNATVEALKRKVWSDDLLQNIYILSKDKPSMTTTDANDTELYDKYMASAQGLKVSEQPERYHWFGSDIEMDELLSSKSHESAIRLTRKFKKGNTLIMADISKKEVDKILNRLDMGEGSLLSLITEDGLEIISHSDSIAENDAGVHNSIFYGSDFYEDAVMSEEASGFQYIKYNNDNYMFIFSKVGDTGAMICALVPRDNIIGQVQDIKNITIIIVILASILASLFGNYIASDMGKAIRYMTEVLKKAANGDFSVSLEVKRKDEFGILAEDIKNMIAHVKGLIQEVKVVGGALFSDAHQVADTSKVFVESTDNIKFAITEIESGVVQLDENSADCIGQMDSLSHKITLVTDNTSQISSITAATANAIDSGIGIMGELNEKTKLTIEIMRNVIATVELLERKSKNIGKIVDVINEIAEQTNLLSLNASIESARAGVHGRGFGVVADEIRKLADQSLKSANQIRAIIEEITTNTSDASKIAKQADVILLEQEAAVNNTTQSFNTMDSQIELLMKELKCILSNIDNMEKDRMKTSDAIMSISAVSEETTACTNTVSDMALQQLTAANQLDSASGELLRRASQLEEAINQFTI